MKDRAKGIIEASKAKQNKERYTFTLTPSVKAALALWCEAEDAKESAVIEELLKATIPEKYFKY